MLGPGPHGPASSWDGNVPLRLGWYCMPWRRFQARGWACHLVHSYQSRIGLRFIVWSLFEEMWVSGSGPIFDTRSQYSSSESQKAGVPIVDEERPDDTLYWWWFVGVYVNKNRKFCWDKNHHVSWITMYNVNNRALIESNYWHCLLKSQVEQKPPSNFGNCTIH